jgi:hypothetical protein
MMIGLIRRRGETASSSPQYPVTASLNNNNQLSIRVWAISHKDFGRLDSWGNKRGASSIGQDDIAQLGIHYAPFNGMERSELIDFLRFMAENRNQFPPAHR